MSVSTVWKLGRTQIDIHDEDYKITELKNPESKITYLLIITEQKSLNLPSSSFCFLESPSSSSNFLFSETSSFFSGIWLEKRYEVVETLLEDVVDGFEVNVVEAWICKVPLRADARLASASEQ